MLQSCMVARLARYGEPRVKEEVRRVVLDYDKASPEITVVVNDLGADSRSVELWRKGSRDRQLRRDVLACI